MARQNVEGERPAAAAGRFEVSGETPASAEKRFLEEAAAPKIRFFAPPPAARRSLLFQSRGDWPRKSADRRMEPVDCP